MKHYSPYTIQHINRKIWWRDNTKLETLSVLDDTKELPILVSLEYYLHKRRTDNTTSQVATKNRYANEIIHTILRDEITQGVLRNRSIRSEEKKQVIIFSNEVDNIDVDRTIPFDSLTHQNM